MKESEGHMKETEAIKGISRDYKGNAKEIQREYKGTTKET